MDARIDNADPERKPLPKPSIRSMHRPLGPVAVNVPDATEVTFHPAGRPIEALRSPPVVSVRGAGPC